MLIYIYLQAFRHRDLARYNALRTNISRKYKQRTRERLFQKEQYRGNSYFVNQWVDRSERDGLGFPLPLLVPGPGIGSPGSYVSP